LATPFLRSFKFRHPWLQINLLTVFITAAVVGFFQGTIDKIVVLAVFLPVLGGQTGNLGCQALAVVLRGMALGELRGMKTVTLIAKEALLGLMNGVVTGFLAGVAIYAVAHKPGGHEGALKLAAIMIVAMSLSGMIAGISGSGIPLILKRLGADPATASAIFLTTITDVVSMGSFLAMVTFVML